MATLTLGTGSGVTFGDFRQRLALKLRDCLMCVGTQDGSTTTFFDERHLVDAYSGYAGSEAIFYEVSNLLLLNYDTVVTDSDPEFRSISFRPALPADTLAGDKLYLINVGGRGFTKQIYDEVIQNAVDNAWPDYKLKISVDSSANFDGDSPLITIPEQLNAVSGLSTLADVNTWREVPASRVGGSDQWGWGYRVDPSTRTIAVSSEYWQSNMNETSYRIAGYGRHPIPELETDLITIDRTWLMLECLSQMAERRAGSREWENWAVEWGRQADQERARIMTPLKPNTVMLP